MSTDTSAPTKVKKMRTPVILSYNEFVTKCQHELEDSAYADRAHYSQSAYSQGCRGPLCTTAMADFHQERRYKEGKISFSELVTKQPDTGDSFFSRKYILILGLLNSMKRPIPVALVHAAQRYGIPITEKFTKELLPDPVTLMYEAEQQGKEINQGLIDDFDLHRTFGEHPLCQGNFVTGHGYYLTPTSDPENGHSGHHQM